MTTYIIIAVVVVLVLGVAAYLATRQRHTKHRQVAAEIRSEADFHRTEIDQSSQQAAEAAARADLARAEAERVEQEAAEAQRRLEMDQARHEDVLREADSIDPDVDHRADDYRPGGAGTREP